jgi:hypothetical protein
MAQPLSEDLIDHRVRVAYLRVQGLARNDTYCERIRRLQDGWEEDGVRVRGLHFDEQGYLASPPAGPHLTLVEEICDTSGLILPSLPERLREVSLDDMLRHWHDRPIVDDVPGWVPQPKAKAVEPSRLAHRDAAQPIAWNDFVSLDEKAIRDAIAEIEEEGHSTEGSAWVSTSLETLDVDEDLHRAPVSLRQLGQRHHGLGDGYVECWKAFDLHRDGIPDTEIAQQLWPELDPRVVRYRVHERLKTARRLINMAYSAEPIQRETRRRRRTAES